MRAAPRSRAGALLLAASLFAGASALASVAAAAPPAVGAEVPEVAIERLDGSTRNLPDRARAVLVVYEDKDAGSQNQHLRALLSSAGHARNRAVLEVVAVGDVSAYDFFPARRFVLADIRKRQERDKNTIWLDWKGAVRARWGLTKGRSGILLVGSDGQARFVAEGPLAPAQVERLTAALTALGCDLS